MYQYPGMGQPMQNPGPMPMYGNGGPPMPQSSNFDPQGQSTSFQGMGRGMYPPNQQNPVRVLPVASCDEAKAVPTDFMGNRLILTDLSHGCIYTKVLDPATGSSIFRTYRLAPDQPPAPVEPSYDAKSEIERLRGELEGIKRELGIDMKEERT